MADIENVLTAFRDWAEADAELRQMLSEFTGYSPSYHLASWYEAAEKAQKRTGDALTEYIQKAIKDALEARRER